MNAMVSCKEKKYAFEIVYLTSNHQSLLFSEAFCMFPRCKFHIKKENKKIASSKISVA